VRVRKRRLVRELTRRPVLFSRFFFSSTLQYIILSSRPPSPAFSTFIASLHPPPHPVPISIVGQHDVDFLRSPFVKHFRSFSPLLPSSPPISPAHLFTPSFSSDISTPTPITALLPIHQTLLSQLTTLIFCSTPSSLRSLSQALDERRAEYSSLRELISSFFSFLVAYSTRPFPLSSRRQIPTTPLKTRTSSSLDLPLAHPPLHLQEAPPRRSFPS